MRFSSGKALAILAGIMSLHSASAQQKQTPFDSYYGKHEKSLQVQIGTTGIGADFKYQLTHGISARAGATAALLSMSGVFNGTDFKSDSKLSATFSNIHLLTDITPFSRLSTFRLVAGAAYFVNAGGNLFIKPTDTYFYGDIPITEEMLGDVRMDISWKGVSPYLGLGIIKAFPKNRFNVNLDMGCYYLRKPQSRIIATGLLQGNETQTPVLQRNIGQFRTLPLLQLNFNYKL